MFPMPSFLGNREQEISGFLNILLPRGDGEGLESKIMKTVLRTWDLLCRSGLVCAGDETQGLVHTKHALYS